MATYEDTTSGIAPGTPVLDRDGRDWSWAFVAFKAVEGWPGYMVGSDGSVWTKRVRGMHVGTSFRKDWKRLRPTPCSGYPRVTLSVNGDRCYRFVHALVLTAFVGRCPEGHEACHRNGERADNRLANLYWGTHTENMSDRADHGRYASGECHPMAKLSDRETAEIGRLYEAGARSVDLAVRFGVCRTTITRAMRRVTVGVTA